MEPLLGLRVVRGPDWKWGEQDGGEGHLGTVVEVDPGQLQATVQWDACNYYRCQYRCGLGGEHDLRVYDSAPAGIKHSQEHSCTWCNQGVAVSGTLWKCGMCEDYHLCTQCYMAKKHSLEHVFERVVFQDYTDRVRLKPRYLRKTVAVKGVFAGARVIRGADWRWGNQNGYRDASPGKVVSIEGWERMTNRSTAKVRWNETGTVNVYRMGHGGKVDLRCLDAVVGGYYYPEDLPVVGLARIANGRQHSRSLSSYISTGDAVAVNLDPDLFMYAQQDHGGWSDGMAEHIGQTGFVATIQDCGDVVVRYSNGRPLLLNPETLTKVDVQHIVIGSAVLVLDDIAKVHEYQVGHGGWNDDMALSLGQVGRVIRTQGNGDFRVEVNGRRWIFNAMCLSPAPGETAVKGELEVDVSLKLQLLSLVEAECPDVVVTAAQAGDTESIVKFLQKYPDEVNTVHEGKGPLHAAIREGFTSVVKHLLQFHADVEMEDGSGQKPLHMCAVSNQAEIARMILKAGANVNSKNSNGVTALELSLHLGHYDVMKELLLHPNINVNIQDGEGKTPLHDAVKIHRVRAIAMLLEAGADPALLDFKLMTPIHGAAGFGFLAGMEELIKRYPQYVNLKKDDGYTPLHVASANGHTDIVSLLASHHGCDVNVKEVGSLTALHIAVHEGYVECVERLVGHGADVNATTDDGNTPLHLALGRKSMRSPSIASPEIKKMEEVLTEEHGRHTIPANVIVALFLVREGANIYMKNTNGVSPLNIQAHDIGMLLTSFAGKGPTPFHGSLKQHKPFADLKPWYPPSRQSPNALLGNGVNGGRVNSPIPGSVVDEGVQYAEKEAVTRANNYEPQLNGDARAVAEPITLCFLCENPADVQFYPCGHIEMCSRCAVRAKKCPNTDCRDVIRGFSEVCLVCRKGSATVTRTSCSHRCCIGCAQRPDCLLCET